MLKLKIKNKKYYFNKFLNKKYLKKKLCTRHKKIILSNEALDISREKRGKRVVTGVSLDREGFKLSIRRPGPVALLWHWQS